MYGAKLLILEGLHMRPTFTLPSFTVHTAVRKLCCLFILLFHIYIPFTLLIGGQTGFSTCPEDYSAKLKLETGSHSWQDSRVNTLLIIDAIDRRCINSLTVDL